jgi:RimJ/RimL family protein N-acetyltransferase
VEDPPLAAAGSRFTRRLRLEPVGPVNARDLWLVHSDDDVWPWYGDEKPSLEQARQQARSMSESWHLHGVHKWIAYDRLSGEVVGRGGLSRTPVDDDWGQLCAFLPAEPWVRAAHEISRPFVAHANWLEIGWALRRGFWGSCTIRHNVRSRAVMERIGMRYAGEIRSRGMVHGMEGEQDDAPFAVSVLVRKDWDQSTAVSDQAAENGQSLPAGVRPGP